jgi:hypothetical protein
MATITATARPVRSRTDDIFFTLMSLVMLGTVLFGFAHTYFLAGMVMAPLPSVLVHVHGAAFTCWILLFLVQTVLIGNGKVRLHRTLGWAGAFLAAAMMVLGLLATSAAIRRGITPPGFTTPSFLLLNDSEVIVFAALVAWAVAVRYDKPIHKRLMLLATLVLMGPAISRWPLHMIVEKPQTIGLFFFIELFSVLVFDLITRHKPYWQTVVVTLAIVALKPLAEGVSHTLAVQHLLEWVMRG